MDLEYDPHHHHDETFHDAYNGQEEGDKRPMQEDFDYASSKKMRGGGDDISNIVSYEHDEEQQQQQQQHSSSEQGGVAPPKSPDHNNNNNEAVDDEPDWDKLGENDPATQEQIELFLKTREIRDQTDDSFSKVMDECNTILEDAKKQILQAAADMHNVHRQELNDLERDIRGTLVWNHEARTKMKLELEETQSRAQGLFSQLLMTVSQPMFVGGGQKREE